MKRFIAVVFFATAAAASFCQVAQPTAVSPAGIITAQPGEPAYYDQYRGVALFLVDKVTSSVDQVKEFRQSPAFRDIGTSTGVQEGYKEALLKLDYSLGLVQQNLLSTPTAVLNNGMNELDAVKRMNQFRE